jgi:hypothetical protein
LLLFPLLNASFLELLSPWLGCSCSIGNPRSKSPRSDVGDTFWCRSLSWGHRLWSNY